MTTKHDVTTPQTGCLWVRILPGRVFRGTCRLAAWDSLNKSYKVVVDGEG